jgi:hypothetical protein
MSVAVDALGNTIVAGGFVGSIDFYCNILTSTSMGSSVFVAKLDPTGACLWSNVFGAPSGYSGGPVEVWADGVAVDAANNILLAGPWSGLIVFGSHQLTGGGRFVAKLDPSGAPLWSTSLDVGSTLYYGQTIAVDASGNVLVLGSLDGSIDIAGHVLTSPPHGGIFVAKLDPGGVPVWGKVFTGLYNTVPGGRSIAADLSGNAFVTGEVDGYADFGCGAPLGGTTFVAKLDPGGACVWNKGYSAGANWAFVTGVAAAPSGQVVITGVFDGPDTVDFGNGPVAGMADQNLFVAMLDADGAPVWARAFGAKGASIGGQAVTVDAAGNVVVTGIVDGSVDFGDGTLTSTGAGGDVFVASFDGGGASRWARLFGAPAVIEPVTIAVDPTCHVVVAGDFQGVLDFGGVPLKSPTTHSLFVAELAR